jgi:hypothetical protein
MNGGNFIYIQRNENLKREAWDEFPFIAGPQDMIYVLVRIKTSP